MRTYALGNAIFDGEDVHEGYLCVEDGQVADVRHDSPPADAVKGLILPGFVNAHTHIGDSFAYPAPRLPLEELVAPPRGYKQERLRSVSSDLKVKGMRESLDVMASCGTEVFVDFREEGLDGIRLLDRALAKDDPRAIRLGRPTDGGGEHEIDELVELADGIGVSSISDHPPELLKKLSRAARSRGKLFSIHVSEALREDMDAVLDLKPHFVVHAVKATEGDLEALAGEGIPVVVCPRSNEFFGLQADLRRMFSAGLTVALGTDNGMICRPDMFEEMRAAYRISGAGRRITPLETVRMATVLGRKVLKAEGNTTAGEKKGQDFVVVRVPGGDPLKELVTTATSRDVLAVVRGQKVRRSAEWR